MIKPNLWIESTKSLNLEGKSLSMGATLLLCVASDQNRYAPFCKHVFVKNFTNAKVSTLRITPENEHLLKFVS